MAKLALTVGGAILGFAIGGPFGAQIGAMIGGMVGNMLFSPSVKGPRLTDLSVTASTYGQTIPEVFGTMRLGGNLIWTTGLIEKKKKSGGKGGPKQVTYSYSASFAIAFCKGPVDGIIRIWADGKLIAGSDPAKTNNTSAEVLAMEAILSLTKKKKGKFKYRFYNGTETQLPDSVIVAKEGVGNVPAYRDLAYIVFEKMPLEDFGNRIPQITVEITRKPLETAPYVNLSSDVNEGDPVWTFPNPRGDIDWEQQKLYKYNTDTHQIITYDMRTMQELYRVTIQPAVITAEQVAQWGSLFGGAPGEEWPAAPFAVSPGGHYFVGAIPRGNNSTPKGFWNAKTGEYIGSFAKPNNGLGDNPMPDSSQPFDPDLAQSEVIGLTRWFRVKLRDGLYEDYLFKSSGVGGDMAIWRPDLKPAYYDPTGNDDIIALLRGREDYGVSDLLMLQAKWNGTDWITSVRMLTVFNDAVMLFNTDGPPFTATNPASVFKTDIIVNPPAKEMGDFRVRNAAYDKSDNSIVMWGDSGADNFGNNGVWRFGKYLIDEDEWKWYWLDTELDPSLATPPLNAVQSVGYPNDSMEQSNLNGGSIGWIRGAFGGALASPARIYTANLQTGQITSGPTTDVISVGNDNFMQASWDDETSSVMGEPTRVFLQSGSEGVTLKSIVDTILTKTGALTPGVDWNSDELSNILVRGYTISRDASARDVLYQLASAYFFDGVESDYIIKCRLRGSEPVATIQEKHLSWVEDKDISLKETRAQEVELPMRVTITYSDIDRDYQDGTQSAKRNTDPFPTMHSHTEQKFELPIAFNATEAKQIADKSLKMAWASRWDYKMKLPWEFLKYDPTDVITVESDEGFAYQMRLAKVGVGVDFSIDTEGTSEKPAAYTSVAVGDPGTGVPPQVIDVGGPVDLYILNTPLLRDSDDTQGVASIYYGTAKAVSPGDWIGAYLFEGDINGEYTDLNAFTTEPTWGITADALPAHYDYAIDNLTVLTVRVMSLDDEFQPDALESCTYNDMLAGKNAALVGDEIIQFMTAEVQPDGKTYKLSGLLRARRGTNYAAPNHVAGERFIMLDTSTMVKQANEPATWEATHYFKAVAKGEYVEDAKQIAIDMEPNDLRPYTPECVKCGDDGANVTITFQRRSRIASELIDGTDAVPYREGQGSLAKFVYNVYSNKTLADAPWETDTPDFTGNVAIFSGVDFAPLTFSFNMAGVTEFVVKIYEVGFVDGFPKIVHFKRVNPNDWDMTELY